MIGTQISIRGFAVLPALLLSTSALAISPSLPPATQNSREITEMPTIVDETNTYQQWNWQDITAFPVLSGGQDYTVSNPDIHGDVESDDLWTNLMMYLRGGGIEYQRRADAWANYFKNEYLNCDVNFNSSCEDLNNHLGDHITGWGLVLHYEYYGDEQAKIAANRVVDAVYDIWTGPRQNDDAFNYAMRAIGRHLHLVSRVAESWGYAKAIQTRDLLLQRIMNSTQWQEEETNAVDLDRWGMFYAAAWSTNHPSVLGAGAYERGDRYQVSYHIGIFMDALYHTYRSVSDNHPYKNEVGIKLIKMANFVDRFSMDPDAQYAGRWYSHSVNGVPWRKEEGTNNFQPAYTTSQVNSLVMGYKLTGNANYLNRAKYFFARAMNGPFETTDDTFHNFVDTRFVPGRLYFSNNRGELQYTYLLFENGGNPTVLGNSSSTVPNSPTELEAE